MVKFYAVEFTRNFGRIAYNLRICATKRFSKMKNTHEINHSTHGGKRENFQLRKEYEGHSNNENI